MPEDAIFAGINKLWDQHTTAGYCSKNSDVKLLR